MMTIDENTLGVWYVQTSPTQDFLGTLSRNADGSGHTFIYRFRYYKDKKHFDSADEKSWYTVKIQADEPDPLSKIKGVIELLAEAAEAPITELLMDKDGPQSLIKRLMAQPFARFKAVPTKET